MEIKTMNPQFCPNQPNETCLNRLIGRCLNCKEDYEPLSSEHTFNNESCIGYKPILLVGINVYNQQEVKKDIGTLSNSLSGVQRNRTDKAYNLREVARDMDNHLLAESQQTNQTIQKGRGDKLNGSSSCSDEFLKVKTAGTNLVGVKEK